MYLGVSDGEVHRCLFWEEAKKNINVSFLRIDRVPELAGGPRALVPLPSSIRHPLFQIAADCKVAPPNLSGVLNEPCSMDTTSFLKCSSNFEIYGFVRSCTVLCTYFVAKDPVKMSYGDWPIELTLLHATHLKLLKQGFIVPPRWAGTPKIAIKSINLLALLNWPVRLQTHHSAKPVFWTLKSKANIDNAWMRLTHLGWSTATYVAWELWVMSLTLWAIVALYFFRSPNSGGMSMQPSAPFSLQIICEYFW